MGSFTFEIESSDGEFSSSRKSYDNCTEAKHAALYCGYARYGDKLMCIYILQDGVVIKKFTS